MNRSLIIIGLLLILLSIPHLGYNTANAQDFRNRSASEDQRLEQRASTLVRLGRTAEAVDLYLEILYKNPGNSNIYFRVSNLLPGQENAPVLLQILEDILKTQSQNTRLLAEKGRLLYLLDRKQEAIQDWESILQKDRKDRFIYPTLTNAMLQAGAMDEAIQLLNEGRTALKDSHAFALDLARIYAAKHNYNLASKEYLSHLDQNPGMLDYISNQLIGLLENETAYESITLNLQKIMALPGDHQALVLAQAKILLHEKHYPECARTILASDVRRSMKDVMTIADDLLAERAWTPAADLYLYISANSKDRQQIGDALLKLASTYEYRLNREEAYKSLSGYFPGNQFLDLDVRILRGEDASLERTLKLYDSLQTLLPRTNEAFLASFHIAEIQLMVSGDVDRAIRGFQNIFDNAPRNDIKLSGGTRLVDAWLAKGDTSAALQSLAKVVDKLNMDEDAPRIVSSRIKIRIHQGDIPRLKKELLNLSGAASPADPIFNDGLELMAVLNGNGPDDDPNLQQYLKAERLVGQHKLAEAIRVLQDIHGDSESIADEAGVRAIQILLALGDDQLAVETMDNFLRTYPDSPWRANVLVWRGEQFQFTQNEPQSAIPYYEEVIVNHPEYLGIQELRVRLRSLIGGGS
ncbi:MAG: tetratricopeptide repeat protein [Candidatus Marinimicrobia bacterium]|nr:tetratricopeptide repeat protein [Candidatus Neomarinimicrobiota bacterium]